MLLLFLPGAPAAKFLNCVGEEKARASVGRRKVVESLAPFCGGDSNAGCLQCHDANQLIIMTAHPPCQSHLSTSSVSRLLVWPSPQLSLFPQQGPSSPARSAGSRNPGAEYDERHR